MSVFFSPGCSPVVLLPPTHANPHTLHLFAFSFTLCFVPTLDMAKDSSVKGNTLVSTSGVQVQVATSLTTLNSCPVALTNYDLSHVTYLTLTLSDASTLNLPTQGFARSSDGKTLTFFTYLGTVIYTGTCSSPPKGSIVNSILATGTASTTSTTSVVGRELREALRGGVAVGEEQHPGRNLDLLKLSSSSAFSQKST